MIELRGIHKYYHSGGQPLHVLKGVDLSIREGELVSIMGSSGSGKSTLLNILGILAANLIPHFPPPAVPWWAVAGATGFSALVGMLFGILPARRAANLAPIDALRHE